MKKIVLVLAAFAATLPAAHAAPPDAGQLLREQQPQRQMPRQLPAPEVDKERPPLTDTSVRVQVKKFTFSGYEGLVAEAELQELVAGAVGKSLSFDELQGLAGTVTAYLREKGWFLARAYLPQQNVTSGVIEIAVIQGRSDGSLTVSRDKTARISEETVRGMVGRAVRSGQPLNEQCLERSILLLNDLPGITAKASLAPGETPGSTGIKIDLSEGPLFSGAVWGDNQGNRYTGSWRGNGTLNVNDPFRSGDQLSLLLTGAEGLTQGRAGYSIPLTPSGLKANLAYTGMRYELTGDLAFLKMEGYSHTIDSGLSYPVLRSRTASINAAVTYEYKTLTDSVTGQDIRDKQLHSGNIALTGDRYDTVLGGGYTTWSAGVTTGSLHENIADIAVTKTEGAYTRFNLGLARLQRLAERLSLNLSWSAQYSLDNLDSSEKFNLGGPNGIRAYPVGEASGDEGHLLNADLRYELPLPAAWGSLQLNGFYDAGRITLHKHAWLNSVNTISSRNEYWLQGGGAGITYAWNSRLSLKTTWAHTIGDNPGRSIAGKDSDGRSEQNRFWLQGMMYF